MKTPFSETLQSFAAYAIAIVGAVALIGWGASRGTPALIASLVCAALFVLGMLKVSVLLARYHDRQP